MECDIEGAIGSVVTRLPVLIDAIDGWTVAVMLRLPDRSSYIVHPSTHVRLVNAVVSSGGDGPVLKLTERTVELSFGLAAEGFLEAQQLAGPIVAQAMRMLNLDGKDAVVVRIMRNVELDGLLDDYPDVPDCVGVGEAAAILGVSKQRVHQLAARPSFPMPVKRLLATPVWRESDVRRFAIQRRYAKPGRPMSSARRRKA